MTSNAREHDQSIATDGYDVVRTQRGVRTTVASNLPKKQAETLMKNLKRRAIDNHTDVYFRIVPHTR